MKKSLRIDFWVVLGIVLGSIPVILSFHVRPLISAFFFFVVPTCYLLFRKRAPLKRIFAGSVLIGGGFGLIFNIIASANNAWNETSSQLVFNYRLFGFWPVDEPVWFFFWALFIIVFYEHFYERETDGTIPKRFKYVAVSVAATLLVVLACFVLNQSAFQFSYAYFLLALPMLIPILYVVKKRPVLLPKFLKTGAFFFMLYFVYEVTALKLGQWYFGGQYVGWVELAGVRFPFEELFFWMTLSSLAVLSLYEGFVDDEK